VLGHADRVASRLRHAGYQARVVVLKVKDADFTLHTRRVTLPQPTADGSVIARAARGLLARVEVGPARKVRLVGVAAAGLGRDDSPRQLSLPESGETPGEGTLGHTLDAIVERFGRAAIRRAADLDDG